MVVTGRLQSRATDVRAKGEKEVTGDHEQEVLLSRKWKGEMNEMCYRG